MNNRLLNLSACGLLAATLTLAEEPHHHEPVHSETGWYAAAKGLITLGNKVDHEGATLEGNNGRGIGLELGYKIGAGFAVESDVTFTRDQITHKEEGEAPVDVDGSFVSYSLDLAYVYHLTHHLGTFFKLGYEYETENINDLEISESETGMAYAAGFEYAVGSHTALMLEYEGSTIDGPLGDFVFAGVLYHF